MVSQHFPTRVPRGWEWAEPSTWWHCSAALSSHEQVEEQKGSSVPAASAPMHFGQSPEPWDAVSLGSAKHKVFYTGNKDTGKFFAGLLSIQTATFLHCYFIKVLIIFVLCYYQDFFKYRSALSRKPSKAKAKFTNGTMQRIFQDFSFPTLGLELFSKFSLKHEQLTSFEAAVTNVFYTGL